jgi:hypothetical protein
MDDSNEPNSYLNIAISGKKSDVFDHLFSQSFKDDLMWIQKAKFSQPNFGITLPNGTNFEVDFYPKTEMKSMSSYINDVIDEFLRDHSVAEILQRKKLGT